MNAKEIHEQYELNVYPKRDVVLVRGKNAVVWDDNGNEYIDCAAGIGVASIGHANEKLTEALTDQSKKLVTCPGIFYNDTRAKLLQRLIEITPPSLKRAFLCNSGTEANEAAIKFARLVTGKTDFVCAMKGFHGRTMGALSATFKPEYRESFEPLVAGFKFAPYNNFEKFVEAIDENTAAVILEVVQGEGGINVGDKEFLTRIQKYCNDNNVLFIIDEIQTGFCRTGKMFACEHFDLSPDILCMAKAIAGGFPMGAVLCSDKINIPIGKHGTTYGGNPLASAAALAAIQFMTDNNLAETSAKKGEYFMSKLKTIKSDLIREVRGLGLMIGVELKNKVQPILVELMKRQVIALPAGTTVLRLLPPLTIEYNQIDIVVDKLREILE